MLDDLYWVTSYSRWKDEAFWPSFRDALRRGASKPDGRGPSDGARSSIRNATITRASVDILRPPPTLAGLRICRYSANLVSQQATTCSGKVRSSVDACIYGFVANILFYPIDTPLRQFVVSHPNPVRHCTDIHNAVGSTASTLATGRVGTAG